MTSEGFTGRETWHVGETFRPPSRSEIERLEKALLASIKEKPPELEALLDQTTILEPRPHSGEGRLPVNQLD